MSEDTSAIDYLLTYGWMFLVFAIVAGAVYGAVQDGDRVRPEFNSSQVSGFLEDRTSYSNCTAEEGFEEGEYDVTCTREVGVRDNLSFRSGERFTVEVGNGSVTVFQDYNY